MFVFLRFIFEFFQLINQGYLKECFTRRKISLKELINWNYFFLYSNYIEVPMYILSAVFLTVLHRDCLCPSHGQWQAGTVSLLLAWITLLLFLNKWPSLGIYIGMLWQIVLRFLMVAIIIVLLLIAFMFAFYMAFYEPSLPVSILLSCTLWGQIF